MSIGIIGEALMDMMPEPNGTLRPMVGGSPFNVVRALGRLHTSCCYLSPLSRDGFGEQLQQALLLEGVGVNETFSSNKPSSLAVVTTDEQGQPNYSLYREGVADRDYSAQSLLANMPASVEVIHTGSLAIVPEDVEKIREILTVARKQAKVISIDINMRPGVVADTEQYISAVKSLLPLADLVKASDEDLMLLGIHGSPENQCQQLRDLTNGGLAVMTLGAKGAIAVSDSGLVRVAGFEVSDIADTVGAGDCFQAGLLSSLYDSGCLTAHALADIPADALTSALRQGCATASLNVARVGCQPPTRDEVQALLNSGE